jgi:hypothetical protein
VAGIGRRISKKGTSSISIKQLNIKGVTSKILSLP